MVLAPKEISRSLDFIISKSSQYSEAERTQSFFDLFGQDIIRFSVVVIGLYLLMGFFMYCMRKTVIVMSRLIEYDMRKEIYLHYQKLDYAFYKRNKTGDLMARVSEDVSKVRMYLGPGLMYGMTVSMLVTFVVTSMFQVNTKLTLFTLLPLPFLSLSIYYVSSIIHNKSYRIQKQISKLNSTAQEVYSGIRIVKSYVKEDQFTSYFSDESESYRKKSLELARVNALFFPLMIILMNISTILAIYVGGTLFVEGEITAGNLMEFIIYIGYLNWPITSIGWIASIIQQAEASQSRINQILEVQPEITNTAENTINLNGKIEFRNVSFTYPDTGIEALKNVSFVVEPGETLAVVGKTASGKSTIADLLLRFYDVSSGEILIDGHNIRDLDLYSLRSQIGYVPQNVFLFSDTIEDNVRFGKAEADLDDVMTYADHAAIGSDILELPGQYQTHVGERGVTLSGGQKQRLSIARALIKEPNIILLDDSLSALDANTEHRILQYLDGALEDKTSIIVTHRISNQMEYDHILVLENGQVQALGKHDELIDMEGYYSQIVKKQYEE
jgi:ATP-binding cassette subfamily B protein